MQKIARVTTIPQLLDQCIVQSDLSSLRSILVSHPQLKTAYVAKCIFKQPLARFESTLAKFKRWGMLDSEAYFTIAEKLLLFSNSSLAKAISKLFAKNLPNSVGMVISNLTNGELNFVPVPESLSSFEKHRMRLLLLQMKLERHALIDADQEELIGRFFDELSLIDLDSTFWNSSSIFQLQLGQILQLSKTYQAYKRFERIALQELSLLPAHSQLVLDMYKVLDDSKLIMAIRFRGNVKADIYIGLEKEILMISECYAIITDHCRVDNLLLLLMENHDISLTVKSKDSIIRIFDKLILLCYFPSSTTYEKFIQFCYTASARNQSWLILKYIKSMINRGMIPSIKIYTVYIKACLDHDNIHQIGAELKNELGVMNKAGIPHTVESGVLCVCVLFKIASFDTAAQYLVDLDTYGYVLTIDHYNEIFKYCALHFQSAVFVVKELQMIAKMADLVFTTESYSAILRCCIKADDTVALVANLEEMDTVLPEDQEMVKKFAATFDKDTEDLILVHLRE